MIDAHGCARGSACPEFNEFYAAHLAQACSLAHLITGSRSLGQEIAPDAMLAVHQEWETLDSPAAFLRAVVVNKARSAQRRLIRERLHLARFDRAEPLTTIPEIDDMWNTIRRLPGDQRTVIVLRFYEDLTLAEIASVLDKPIGTVTSSLHRAVTRLKGDGR